MLTVAAGLPGVSYAPTRVMRPYVAVKIGIADPKPVGADADDSLGRTVRSTGGCLVVSKPGSESRHSHGRQKVFAGLLMAVK